MTTGNVKSVDCHGLIVFAVIAAVAGAIPLFWEPFLGRGHERWSVYRNKKIALIPVAGGVLAAIAVILLALGDC